MIGMHKSYQVKRGSCQYLVLLGQWVSNCLRDYMSLYNTFQNEWKCSICIRGSATRDVQPSQSFLKATAAAQKRNQPVIQQEDPKIPAAPVVNRAVGKRQESFDSKGGPPKPSRASR